jgi:hypothetical protein
LRVDATHAEPIGAALCNIQQTPSHITLDIFTERTVCPEALAAAAVPPAEAVGGQVMRGAEVVVEGVLINEGNNYFTDRRLVVKGEGPEGGEILVTTPLPLETALPATAPGAPTAAVAPQDPTAAPRDLSDVLGKKVLVRGHVQRAMQKGVGMTDVLVIEELELAQ